MSNERTTHTNKLANHNPQGFQKALLTIRFLLGWLFLYAGAGKLTMNFSVQDYLLHAIPDGNPFTGLWTFFAGMPGIDLLIPVGLVLVGLSLLLGAGVRIAAIAGSFMMIMFWMTAYPFPKAVVFIVQENVIYITLLLATGYFNAGHYKGIDGKVANHPVVQNNAVLKKIIG